ncbi:hypothetical protein [Streptomyces sp. NPDC004284]|uniref:hypothetical protein n=1 Tax=Streptomyces sp. NPDC004284 TaxID=3364695 RepID=UPI0036807018
MEPGRAERCLDSRPETVRAALAAVILQPQEALRSPAVLIGDVFDRVASIEVRDGVVTAVYRVRNLHGLTGVKV